jgi:hypothetical protein
MVSIVPDAEKVHTAGDLAKALGKVRLTAKEAKAWRRDLKKAREGLTPQPDKWAIALDADGSRGLKVIEPK